MKVLQINTIVNSGSTGRIAEDIGKLLIKNGHESYIAHGRGNRPSKSKLLKIGNDFDIYLHGLKTLLSDKHGFGSRNATLDLIKKIEQIKPDVIGLHNLHGYYINIEILFNYLKISNINIIWTLHDCWAFTGHCTHYENIGCNKWQTICSNCPKKNKYPKSLIDNSALNFNKKKELFNSLNNLLIVTPSHWLENDVKKSFLNKFKVKTIYNGIDLNSFKFNQSLKYNFGFENKKIILGVANSWQVSKGLNDFEILANKINDNLQIVLIGLSKSQIKKLPKNIIGIEKTQSLDELASWYSIANVFVNPTYLDNFPTTNIESLACGTPVITYNTGGSPEAIDKNTGIVVNKGDIDGLKNAIELIINNGKNFYQTHCRKRAELLFNKNDRYKDYIDLYNSVMHKNND